jgi:cell division protein FtsB
MPAVAITIPAAGSSRSLSMRIITLALAALLLLIQYPLWLGKGGWLTVSDLESQVAASRAKTEQLKARNAKLESEVNDLKNGTEAVEERARYELGMIKSNEIFVQVLKKDEKPAVMMTPPPPPRPPKDKKTGQPNHAPGDD